MTKSSAHAYLSPEAREALDKFSAEQGVTFSGLVEGLARAVIEGHDLRFLVMLARRVDAQRRRR